MTDCFKTYDRLHDLWPQTPRTNDATIEIPNVGRDDLARLFNSLDFRFGAEIGTERGIYAATLCAANPGLHLNCIDPYKAYSGYREHKSQDKLTGFYVESLDRLAQYNADIYRYPSVEGSRLFRDHSLDFVYIDGNHSLLHVIQDLCHWVPKVRPGGIVAGHDYIRRTNYSYAMHVVQAIHAYCDAYMIKPLYILGRKAIIPGEVRDKPRSWMFVKE